MENKILSQNDMIEKIKQHYIQGVEMVSCCVANIASVDRVLVKHTRSYLV